VSSSVNSRLHEKQTEAFIDASPSDLVLKRKVFQDDGAGGVRLVNEPDLSPQKVRVVGLRTPRPRITSDGKTILIEKEVVGMPNLDVEIGDTFSFMSKKYEVINVNRSPMWRILAEASSRG